MSSPDLEIKLAPELLDSGSEVERATFGLLTIRADGKILSEGFDTWVNAYRPGPLVSAYYLAEWLVWNWWRLRWEPQTNAKEAWRSHHLGSIGEGYVWPNIDIYSDGYRVALTARPSARPDAMPFRYLSSQRVELPANRFEEAVDGLVAQVKDRLRSASIVNSNLDVLWKDLIAERTDPSVAIRRKFEALRGMEPDEMEIAEFEGLARDAETVGLDALGEVLADPNLPKYNGYVDTFQERAIGSGFSSATQEAVSDFVGVPFGEKPAWLVGTEAAEVFRRRRGLATGPVSNASLSELAGVPQSALEDRAKSAEFSYLLELRGTSRLVLRSKWNTGRRFELARILGDVLMRKSDERLFPVTAAYTYRQRAQRAFAAELLAPFSSVCEALGTDSAMEAREEVAEHFQISELAIRTMLVNHRLLDRQALEDVNSLDFAA